MEYYSEETVKYFFNNKLIEEIRVNSILINLDMLDKENLEELQAISHMLLIRIHKMKESKYGKLGQKFTD